MAWRVLDLGSGFWRWKPALAWRMGQSRFTPTYPQCSNADGQPAFVHVRILFTCSNVCIIKSRSISETHTPAAATFEDMDSECIGLRPADALVHHDMSGPMALRPQRKTAARRTSPSSRESPSKRVPEAVRQPQRQFWSASPFSQLRWQCVRKWRARWMMRSRGGSVREHIQLISRGSCKVSRSVCRATCCLLAIM